MEDTLASAFAHIVIPAVVYIAFKSDKVNRRVCLLAALLSVLPDADVIAFHYGIPYESPWGHRGFTHSLAFAACVAGLCALIASFLRSSRRVVFLVCFTACASHALLDAMTNGGLGVAIAWPLNQQRYFLPFRPIQVSPIGAEAFFSERGLHVIYSELIWVFFPAAAIALALKLVRYRIK